MLESSHVLPLMGLYNMKLPCFDREQPRNNKVQLKLLGRFFLTMMMPLRVLTMYIKSLFGPKIQCISRKVLSRSCPMLQVSSFPLKTIKLQVLAPEVNMMEVVYASVMLLPKHLGSSLLELGNSITSSFTQAGKKRCVCGVLFFSLSMIFISFTQIMFDTDHSFNFGTTKIP